MGVPVERRVQCGGMWVEGRSLCILANYHWSSFVLLGLVTEGDRLALVVVVFNRWVLRVVWVGDVCAKDMCRVCQFLLKEYACCADMRL